MHQHTLGIFDYILANIPPLFPADVLAKMKAAKEQLEHDSRATREMVEDTMIKFGYDLWPWNEAYRDQYAETEGRLGEQFLLSHLSPELGQNFLKYREYGLSWKDLYTGRAAKYYDEDDRAAVGEALVKTRTDLIRFVDQEIMTVNKNKYLGRVEDYKNTLEKIKNVIMALRALAADEQYHPILADEIRAKIRHFEMGLCLLAPSFDLSEVNRALEFFADRKYHLNLMRGIDKPVSVDFYGIK